MRYYNRLILILPLLIFARKVILQFATRKNTEVTFMSFFKTIYVVTSFLSWWKFGKSFNYSSRIIIYDEFFIQYVKTPRLSSCLPPNLPCDFPSIRIRVCTCFNEQYICRYCRETYYVILNRVQYECAFLCECLPLNTFLFTVMKSKLSCFVV